MNANIEIAHAWIANFNTHDVANIIALYHDNAEHYSPKLKLRDPQTLGYIKGKAQMRTWWADAFTRLPTLHYQLLNVIADDHKVLMEYRRTVDGEDSMMVAEILEIENGLIVKSRVYHG